MTHITEANGNTIQVGDMIEQAGATYYVVAIERSDAFNGRIALYLTWSDGVGDLFTAPIRTGGHVGQIRWAYPARMRDDLFTARNVTTEERNT